MNKIERDEYAHQLATNNMSPKSMRKQSRVRLRHVREEPLTCSERYIIYSVVMSLEAFFKEERRLEQAHP